MKLLFDQNLSFKLCTRLNDLFPNSEQVRLLGMAESSDQEIWQYASVAGLTIVTQDSDFADMAVVFGPPTQGFMVALRKSTDGVHRKAIAPAFRGY